ncbi:hypothetical protein RI367_003908 [Sorochytrium milnesiophthora]
MVTRLAEQTDGAGTSDSDTVILQQTERGSVSKRVLSTLWGEQRQDDAAACMQVQPKHDVYVENYSRILVPKQSVDQQQAVPMLKPTLFRWSEWWQVAFPTMRVGEKAVITCDGAYVRSLGHLIRLPSGIDSIEHTVKILGIASVQPDESEADQEARFEHYKVLANELYRGCDFANALSMYQMLEHAASGRSSDAFRSLLGSASANASMCYVKLSRYQDALRAFEQILALEDISDVLKQKTLLRKAQTLATTGAEREAVALLKRLRIDCSESDSPQIQALLPDVQRQLANSNQAFRGLAGKLAPVASSSSSSSPPPSAEGSTPAQQEPTQEEAAEEQEQEMDPETQELINKARQAAATLDIHQIRRDMLSIFSPHTLTPLLSLIRWFGHYAGLRPILNAQRALGRPLINEVVWLLIRNSFITLYDCTPSASNPAGRPVRQLQMPEGVFLFNVLGAHIKVPDAEAKQMPGEVIDQLVPITLDDTQLQQLQKKVHIRYLHRYLLSHFTSVEAVPLTKTINAATNSFGYAQNRLWTSKTPIGERNSIVTAYINLLAKKRAIELQPPVGPRKARVWIKDYYQTWSRIDDETDSTTDDNYASDDSD